MSQPLKRNLKRPLATAVVINFDKLGRLVKIESAAFDNLLAMYTAVRLVLY